MTLGEAMLDDPIPQSLDAAYERQACWQGANTKPVFPENIEWLRKQNDN